MGTDVLNVFYKDSLHIMYNSHYDSLCWFVCKIHANVAYYISIKIISLISCGKKNRSKTHKKLFLRLSDVRQLLGRRIKFVLKKFLRLLIIKRISGRNYRLTSFHFAMNELLVGSMHFTFETL